VDSLKDGRTFPEGNYAYLRGRRNSKRISTLEKSLKRIIKRLNAIEDDLEAFYETFGFFPISEEDEMEVPVYDRGT